jgi:hypothetical protein
MTFVTLLVMGDHVVYRVKIVFEGEDYYLPESSLRDSPILFESLDQAQRVKDSYINYNINMEIESEC